MSSSGEPVKVAARRRAIRQLEQLLEADAWPSGLGLTSGDRATIERNLERLRRQLAELTR